MEKELKNIRNYLEVKWEEWKKENDYSIEVDDTLSRDMCRFTSVFLFRWLSDNYPEIDWKFKGGIADRSLIPPDTDTDVSKKGGYLCYGIWFGHFWIEGNNKIIDLTADQFNGDEIIITDLKDERYLSNMTNKELMDAMVFGAEDAHEWYCQWEDNNNTILKI